MDVCFCEEESWQRLMRGDIPTTSKTTCLLLSAMVSRISVA